MAETASTPGRTGIAGSSSSGSAAGGWLSAILSIVGDVGGGVVSVWGQKRQERMTNLAQEKAYRLAMLQRSDELGNAAANRKITLKELAQRKKESDQQNQIARGQLAVSQGTLALNQSQFEEGKRQYSNAEVQQLAKIITDRANSNPEYKQQLLQFWGA